MASRRKLEKRALNRTLNWLREEDKGAVGQPLRDQFTSEAAYRRALFAWSAGTIGTISKDSEDEELRLKAAICLAELADGYIQHRERIFERRREREEKLPDSLDRAPIEIIVTEKKDT